VQHLYDCTETNGSGAGVTEQVRGEQEKRRTNALAAAFAQILRNLSNGADAGGGIAAQLLLDCHEVFSQQVENFSCRRYRQGAQDVCVLTLSISSAPMS